MEIKDVSNWDESCDNCEYQEDGKHYCLLHGITVTNMNVVCCEDWQAKTDNMNNKAEVLMPCPFCGSDDTDGSYSVATRTDTGNKTYYGAGCNSCGCQTDTFECKCEAIKAWNTRKGCAEVAREAVANCSETQPYLVMKNSAISEINKAFGVSDE